MPSSTPSTVAAFAASTRELLRAAADLQPELSRFRRAMHADPEVGLDLPRTQARVLDALNGLGFEITTGTKTSSVGAVLRGTGSGGTRRGGTAAGDDARPAVLLRADMTRCRSSRTPASTSPPPTGPCMLAATTCTRPCWSEPHGCWRSEESSSPETSCSCSSPARREWAGPRS